MKPLERVQRTAQKEHCLDPTTARLFAFDLDDTLAPSKSPIDPRMAALLSRLLAVVPVCIISGGHFGQFQSQVINRLAADTNLMDLHLMPTCGTQNYRHIDNRWQQVYAEDLSDDEKTRALTVLEREARAFGFWESTTWGPILEDRGSQITFSALGQAAPVIAKAAWDPTAEKKRTLRDVVARLLPDLEVRSGGSTSVDVTRKGIDKAYGISRLAELTGITLADMIFVGDRLDPTGNDYPVKALGVACHEVDAWEDTADWLDDVLLSLSRKRNTP